MHHELEHVEFGRKGKIPSIKHTSNQWTKSMDELYKISSEVNSKPIQDQYTKSVIVVKSIVNRISRAKPSVKSGAPEE